MRLDDRNADGLELGHNVKIDPKIICIITGSRAEYGLLKPLISKLCDDPAIDMHLVVTGSHLISAFGETYKEIERDGFFIHAKIAMELDSDSHSGMARATGLAIVSFSGYFEAYRPDILVVLGDRFEVFAAVIAAAMLCIPIAHIAGGDTSEGAVDEFIRHCITKMSYLHFPTNEQSRKRILQLGESPSRVFNVGALNIDAIISLQLLSLEELNKTLSIELSGEYALVTFHPATLSDDDAVMEFSELLRAIDRFPDMKFIFTKANADSGGQSINTRIDEFVATRSNCVAYASLGSLLYLSVMKHASLVIGNSSSGLYEAPFFGVPCVNIGDRQRGRLCADNVINCLSKANSIEIAMQKARTYEFRTVAKDVKNPFGDGYTSEKIIETMKDFLSRGIVLQKEFYLLS